MPPPPPRPQIHLSPRFTLTREHPGWRHQDLGVPHPRSWLLGISISGHVHAAWSLQRWPAWRKGILEKSLSRRWGEGGVQGMKGEEPQDRDFPPGKRGTFPPRLSLSGADSSWATCTRRPRPDARDPPPRAQQDPPRSPAGRAPLSALPPSLRLPRPPHHPPEQKQVLVQAPCRRAPWAPTPGHSGSPAVAGWPREAPQARGRRFLVPTRVRCGSQRHSSRDYND